MIHLFLIPVLTCLSCSILYFIWTMPETNVFLNMIGIGAVLYGVIILPFFIVAFFLLRMNYPIFGTIISLASIALATSMAYFLIANNFGRVESGTDYIQIFLTIGSFMTYAMLLLVRLRERRLATTYNSKEAKPW